MYLKDQLEKVVINLVIDQPQLWPRVKAGWFYSDAASAVAWMIYNYNKVSGLMPTREEIFDALDWNRLKASENEIKLLLQPINCELGMQKQLLEWFEMRGMMFELMEDHIRTPQSHETVQTMQHISERMKTCQEVSVKDYLFVSQTYGKIKKQRANENQLQRRSQTPERRMFSRY